MNIILVGYGKMGRIIEQTALKHGHTIVGKIDLDNAADLDESLAARADVAIEFTGPHSAFDNVMRCLTLGLPVVCGSTGWLDRYEEAVAYCRERSGTMLYASNFSVGVNIFFEINKTLARLMAAHPSYDVSIREVHHTQKKDAPSGTAISLAEQVLRSLPHKEHWTGEATDKSSDLLIKSERIDPYPGLHTVRYASAVDEITITHEAHTRDGFALGAVLAAAFIHDKHGVFSMRDVLGIGD
jgi:4-hydroxy-tetrahydrodipicolinate reductase